MEIKKKLYSSEFMLMIICMLKIYHLVYKISDVNKWKLKQFPTRATMYQIRAQNMKRLIIVHKYYIYERTELYIMAYTEGHR